jgi:DNA-binding CsgD family transcriptional regulator
MMQANHELGRPMDCRGVWDQLVRGSLRVTDSFSAEERGYLVLARVAPKTPLIAARTVEVLERTLLGESQKVLSIDLGLSVSSIATLSRRSLLGLGLDTLPSKAPALLSLLVQASRSAGQTPEVRAAEVALGALKYTVLSVGLRAPAHAFALSPAEQVVIRMRLEGRSLLEIASERRTSKRTVANQLGAAFRRLGVSGRSSLIRQFARAEGELTAAE